ncbi:MAG: hypothetical protein NW226_17625 [Microscillaceae bacterium]|nr:hypothetical protein [Microscillaceae bacterium]
MDSGVFYLSRGARELMGLQGEYKLEVLENENKEFFLLKSTSGYAFKGQKNKNDFVFCCKSLVNVMADTLNIPENALQIKMPVFKDSIQTEQGTTVFQLGKPIVTKKEGNSNENA